MSPLPPTISELATGIEQTAIASPKPSEKPHLVFGATPADGHTNPLLRIAEELIRRGFEVTFIGGGQYEDAIKSIGAKHIPIPFMLSPKQEAEREANPAGIPRLLYDVKHIFVDQTPGRWEIVKQVLEDIRAEDPEREVVLVPESCFMGVNPLSLGAPLPKGYTTRPRVVNVHSVPYMATSVDTGPFGPGLPPDSTASGRARNQLMNQMMVAGPFAQVIAYQDELLKELGTTELLEPQIPFHHWMLMHDVTLQMCPPSLEYPRSDMPSNVKFAGCLTPKPIRADFAYPSWWMDVKRGDRRIIAVTQGTVACDYNDLVVPTVQALADRDDLLVVAILGKRNAILPEGVAVPPNTRVIDFLPYDVLLPHASVFVMNAGYGGFLHGIANGVPLVLGGASEDKPEIAMRGEWSGVAVNLRTGRPTPELVRAGVERILADDSFKRRVDEIRAGNEAIKVFDFVEKEILSVGDLEA
ncbi:hypothetical protein F66182_7719 [Fusarium sp. NRRL 66182]|nr:hypothetical protein F66182_7719 [Fusarium sp. NRRL 66182]